MEQWQKHGRDRVRYLVRQRDGFRCQRCKKGWKRGTRHFDVHHLHELCGKKSRGYDKNSDMDGLITLCHKCHFASHSKETRTKNKYGRSGTLAFDRAEAQKLRTQGMSYDKIALKLGVSYTAIQLALTHENRKNS